MAGTLKVSRARGMAGKLKISRARGMAGTGCGGIEGTYGPLAWSAAAMSSHTNHVTE